MALTLAKFSPDADYVAGNKRIKFRKVTFDSSYATGGESLAAADVGLKRIVHVSGAVARNTEGAGDGTRAVFVRWDKTNQKLVAYWYDPAQAAAETFRQVANTTDLSTYAVELELVGH